MVTNVDPLTKDARNYTVKRDFNETTGFGVVTNITVFDVSKDIIFQINANSQAYDLEVTSHAGKDNVDIEDAAVPWIKLKDAITADFHSGQGLNNRGIIAIKVTTAGALTGIFEIFGAQQALDERPT